MAMSGGTRVAVGPPAGLGTIVNPASSTGPGAGAAAATAAGGAATAGTATAPAPRPPQPAQPSTSALTPSAEQQRALEAAEQAGVPQGEAPRPQPAVNPITIGRNEVVRIMDPSSGETQELKYKKAQALLEQGWRLVNR